MKKIVLLFIFYMLVFALSPFTIHAGLRGMPEGKPRVEVGDKAPLLSEDLEKAHKEGKVILLFFGNPSHCVYCEKVWNGIEYLVAQYGSDKVVGIIKTHRPAKFFVPDPKDVELGKIYGVIGEPWLYLIDKKGIVRHIFIGLAMTDDIEVELKKALENQ